MSEQRGMYQFSNWRSPRWLSERQIELCKAIFDGEDPELSQVRFRDYLLEELAYFVTRELSDKEKNLRARKEWQELVAIAPITALMRSAMHTLHTALALKAQVK